MIVTDIVQGRRAAAVGDVVDMMTAIESELNDQDGLWWFNHLYLQVTLGVRGAVTTSTFQDPAFLERLDVVFGNLYFDAIATGDRDPRAAPSAWRPLLECRRQAGIRPLQFALAGMNAHINRDLPQGIVASFLATDGAPTHTGPRFDDFNRVNGLLETVEAQIKVAYSTGVIAVIDAAGGDADDQLAMWNVRAAREAAWTNAEVLWSLRATPRLRDAFYLRLDRFTGFAGRGLLVPSSLDRGRSLA